MRTSGSSSHLRSSTDKVRRAALLGFLLAAAVVVVVVVSLQDSTSNSVAAVESLQLSSYANISSSSLPIKEPQTQTLSEDADAVTAPEEENRPDIESATVDDQIALLKLEYEQNEDRTETSPIPARVSRVVCDFTQPRSDTCSIDGDVRVIGRSSAILLASPLSDPNPSLNTSWKLRPYPRKWESTIDRIKELTVALPADAEPPPPCTVNHRVPAVLFSTGGFVGNYFHDFTDVLIPLFMTARRFDGEVQLVVTDFNYPFMDKYRKILTGLSRYPPINLDADGGNVHCFPQAHVGLFSHRALGIDTTRSPGGVSMADFREFLRKRFSLKRRYSRGIDGRSRSKPRLLLILRKGSRAFVNEREVMRMVKGMGFKLIMAGPEETRNLSRFAKMVNSVDVLMGVHGAGLTNMVFLPSNATLVQIIHCCGVADGCRYIFGEPAPAMGIKYVEYEIGAEESSLIEQYPRDHAVFRDPLSILKLQGFNNFWNVFLNKQKKGLVQQQRTASFWRSSMEMQLREYRSSRMKMIDLEMKMLNGFLVFFVIFWMWDVVWRRRFFFFLSMSLYIWMVLFN